MDRSPPVNLALVEFQYTACLLANAETTLKRKTVALHNDSDVQRRHITATGEKRVTCFHSG